ncbi:MAG: hypothetical protein U5K79_16200 [Cyclobacteriaceae bacterium]|nr:hypothetical protein [Cyclobacteriaceae bacterium]
MKIFLIQCDGNHLFLLNLPMGLIKRKENKGGGKTSGGRVRGAGRERRKAKKKKKKKERKKKKKKKKKKESGRLPKPMRWPYVLFTITTLFTRLLRLKKPLFQRMICESQDSFDDLKGEKITLVGFWATWCSHASYT